MKKRMFSAILWFYAGWTFGAMVSAALAISPMFGPIIGLAAATLFVWDPRGLIWTAASSTTDPN